MIGTTSTKSGTPIAGDSATTNVVRIFYLNKVTFLLNIIARMEADVPLALEPDATSAFQLAPTDTFFGDFADANQQVSPMSVGMETFSEVTFVKMLSCHLNL